MDFLYWNAFPKVPDSCSKWDRREAGCTGKVRTLRAPRERNHVSFLDSSPQGCGALTLADFFRFLFVRRGVQRELYSFCCGNLPSLPRRGRGWLKIPDFPYDFNPRVLPLRKGESRIKPFHNDTKQEKIISLEIIVPVRGLTAKSRKEGTDSGRSALRHFHATVLPRTVPRQSPNPELR